MATDPKVEVLLDAAREVYGDDADVVRWIQRPESVRVLLRALPTRHCQVCDTYWLHADNCALLRAWDALDDVRGHVAVARAWDETAQDAEWDRAPDVVDGRSTRDLAAGEFISVRLDASGMRLLLPRLTPSIAHYSGLCAAPSCEGHCGFVHARGCEAVREYLADHGGEPYRAPSKAVTP